MSLFETNSKRQRIKRKERFVRGFTLIEVIIALSVFVIGIVLLFPLFSGALQMLGDIDSQTTVANLARGKMAEIEAVGFQSSPADVARTAFPDPYAAYDYQINWRPVGYDVAASANPILFEATLTIYWQRGGAEKNQKFITFISRQQPY
jgi:prepilin-type N-terminal cleavage/methylation domain-containing protein